MPLYEYECESCANRFELIRKFSDPPVETCPKCGGHVRKLFSSPAIQFKGSGWYITDYAKKGGTEAGQSGGTKPGGDKSSDGGSNADASAKSDSSGKSETGGKSEPTTKSDSSGKSDSGGPSKSSSDTSAAKTTSKSE
jgi:putative FmdB family regulatory protein